MHKHETGLNDGTGDGTGNGASHSTQEGLTDASTGTTVVAQAAGTANDDKLLLTNGTTE